MSIASLIPLLSALAATGVADLNPTGSGLAAPTYFAVYGGRLFFAGNDGSTGLELYSTDGTDVSLVGDINPGAGASSPTYLVVYDDTLYFAASDGSSGTELWMYHY